MSNVQKNIELQVAEIPDTLDPDTKSEYNWVGKRGVRRIDGFDKASGRSEFARDLFAPGMLYARMMSSPHAHAMVKSMDTTKAEALSGVKAVLRFDDPNPMVAFYLTPRPLYEGEPCAVAVAADTEDIAEEALRLVEIEWDVLPFALEPEEALADGFPVIYNFHQMMAPGLPTDTNAVKGTSLTAYNTSWHEPGDVEQGFQESENVMEIYWRREENLQSVPCYCGLAVWGNRRSDQSSEGPVNQWFTYTPGNYGAGGMCAMYPPGVASLLAAKTGRNVKCNLHPRQAFVIPMADDAGYATTKVGFNNDGTIVALEHNPMYFSRTIQSGIQFVLGNTKIPNVKCNYNAAAVNRPITMANRSEMRVNTTTIDMVTNHVAAALDMDPTEIALKNNGWEAHDTTYLEQFATDHGFTWKDSLKACIDSGKAAIGWDDKWHAPGTKQLENGNMHGLGFTWALNWHSGSFSGHMGLCIDDAGKVHIITTMTEYGTNHGTTYGLVVAEELGCNYSDVHHRANHPYDSFVPWVQGGSGGCAVNTNAIKKAAQMLKPQILKLACLEHVIPPAIDGIQDEEVLTMRSLFPGLEPEDLDIKNSFVFEKANPDNKQPLSLVASRQAMIGFGAHVGRMFGFGFAGQGVYGETGPRPEMSRLCSMSEIEVDPETGHIQVKKSVFVNDVGKVIHPETCEGQMYGAGIMGISRVLMEEAIYDPATGVKLNDNFIDYKFSTLRDVEITETKTLESELAYGAYGCGGVGENQSDSAGQGITAALYNATGKWVMEWPLTPNKVLKALGKA